MKTNIAIFSSGSGNSSKKLLENINQLNSNINLIIIKIVPISLIIELAKKYKISYIYLPKKKNISNIDYDTQLVNILTIL